MSYGMDVYFSCYIYFFEIHAFGRFDGQSQAVPISFKIKDFAT